MPDIRFNYVEDIIDYPEDALSDGIVILGTSTDGPQFTPRRIHSLEAAINIFQDGELITGCQEVFTINPFSKLYVIRVGEEDISLSERYTLMDKAYNILSESLYDVSFIVPIKGYFNSELDFASQLADICNQRMSRGYGSIGIIGVSDTFNVKDSIRTISNGNYISVLAAQLEFYINKLNPSSINAFTANTYISTGECAYASLIASLHINISPTNKGLNVLDDLSLFSKEQSIQMADKGITTLRHTIRRGWVIRRAVTLAQESYLKNINNMRLSLYVQNLIRSELDDYIGNPAFQAIKATNKIDDALSQLQDEEVIRDYNFETKINTYFMDINLRLVPVQDISTIQTNLKLTLRRG